MDEAKVIKNIVTHRRIWKVFSSCCSE